MHRQYLNAGRRFACVGCGKIAERQGAMKEIEDEAVSDLATEKSATIHVLDEFLLHLARLTGTNNHAD